MESPKRKRDWIPHIERSLERSRLESPLMAWAYEQVLPLGQRRGASQCRSNESTGTAVVPARQAAGA